RPGSVGQRPRSGFFDARYWVIAFDSQRVKPSSSSTGIFWFGLIAVKAGLFCPPLRRSTRTSSKGSSRWCAVARTLIAFGEGGKTWSFIDASPFDPPSIGTCGFRRSPLVAGADLAYLDAGVLRRGALVRDRDGLLLGTTIDEEEAADHLLGFGEG